MRNHKTSFNQKGFTLIELIISIAIFTILAIAFLPALTTGYKNIVIAGEKSDTMFDNQDNMEQTIVEGASVNTGNMTISFPADASNTAYSITPVAGQDVANGSFRLFIPAR